MQFFNYDVSFEDIEFTEPIFLRNLKHISRHLSRRPVRAVLITLRYTDFESKVPRSFLLCGLIGKCLIFFSYTKFRRAL
jgi:hypothetical protein